MFKKTGQQPPPEQPKRAGRHRMTFINGVPKLQDIRLLLSEAQNQRGTLCELPITASKGTFLLSCQCDNLSPDPSWALYEGESGSQLLWSYMDGNFEMIADIVSMSVSHSTTGSVSLADLGLPAPLPPEADPEKMAKTQIDPNPFASDNNWSNAVDKPAPVTAQAPQQPGWVGQPNPFNSGSTTDWSASQNPGWGAQQPASAQPASPFVDSPLAAQTGWGAPQSQQPTGQGWGQNTGAADPGQVWAAPEPFAPAQNPQGASVENASAPFAPQTAASQPTYAQMDMSNQQPQNQPSEYPTAPANQQSKDSIWKNPVIAGRVDAGAIKALLDSRPQSTMSELAMEPSFPPVIADAAMRLQEMVLKGHFNDVIAREALKLTAENGGLLDEAVITAARLSTARGGGEYAAPAVVILQKAQLLTAADIANVEMMTPEAVVIAVQKTGKIDEQLFGSAKECARLISQGRLHEHQAIMALHYCQRLRASLEDAFEELSIML